MEQSIIFVVLLSENYENLGTVRSFFYETRKKKFKDIFKIKGVMTAFPGKKSTPHFKTSNAHISVSF